MSTKETLRNLKLIKEQETKFQTIRLYETEDNKLLFTLDTYIQFIEGEDEQIYHDNLTRPAYEMNPSAKDFLILGGGDGLVARNIFDLNSHADITLVDIDLEVVKMFLFERRLYKLNKMSLHHVKKYFEDVLKWVPNCNKKFDIIICDLPDPNGDELEKLYEENFYSDVVKLLNKNGIISIQAHDDIKDKVAEIIKKLLGNVKTINYEMPFLDCGAIIIGHA